MGGEGERGKAEKLRTVVLRKQKRKYKLPGYKTKVLMGCCPLNLTINVPDF